MEGRSGLFKREIFRAELKKGLAVKPVFFVKNQVILGIKNGRKSGKNFCKARNRFYERFYEHLIMGKMVL